MTYLVMARTNLDDFPVCIKRGKRSAQKAAKDVGTEEFNRLAELFGVDNAGLCNISIVALRDGKPVEMWIEVDEVKS